MECHNGDICKLLGTNIKYKTNKFTQVAKSFLQVEKMFNLMKNEDALEIGVGSNFGFHGTGY